MADLTDLRPTPIVALDVGDEAGALAILDRLGALCSFYKVGSELFTAAGPSIVRAIQGRGASVFLDLKLYDIPNTVRGAARSAAALGVRLLTLHASGGRPMLEAAVAGAREGGSCDILAVTVLTSLDRDTLSRSLGRPVESVEVEVLRYARIAADAGAYGVVCSGREAQAVRDSFGDGLATLIPGVRLASGDRQDQVRVVTPRQAADAGARYIVLGRAVTAAPDPARAMREVLADLS